MNFLIFLLILLSLNVAIHRCVNDEGTFNTLTKFKDSFGHKSYIDELAKAPNPTVFTNLDPEINLTLTLVTGSMENTLLVVDYYSSLKDDREQNLSLFNIISQTSLHVRMSSKVKYISQVFNTSFLDYKCPNKLCYASTSDVYIPVHLNEKIVGILGLEEVLSLKPNFVRGKKINDSPVRPFVTTYNDFLGPQVAQIYNFPNSDGAGIRISIISLGGYFNQSDLNSYFTTYNLGASVPQIGFYFFGGAQFDYIDLDDDSSENYLDIEIVASVAPKANITLYYAQNSIANLYSLLDLAMQQSDVVSLSWGITESSASLTYRNSFNVLFDTYSSVPVFVATGNKGSTGGVGFPASCTKAIGIIFHFFLFKFDSFKSEFWIFLREGDKFYIQPIVIQKEDFKHLF